MQAKQEMEVSYTVVVTGDQAKGDKVVCTMVTTEEEEVSIKAAHPHQVAPPSPTPSSPADIFGGLTVGHLLGEGAVGCKLMLNYDLGDAASALHASGRSAAAVADDSGSIVGLLTENDIVRAFFEGAFPTHKLGDWLHSGMARAPELVAQKLTVKPSTSLAEVAERMVSSAVRGGSACHHVLVTEEDGHLCGVLSTHDMIQALCRPEMWGDPELHHLGSGGPMSGPMEATYGMLVGDVMKSRDDVFVCPPTDTLRDVLRVLLVTQQNSALVVDDRGIYGLVTPRDAVKAFADGISSTTNIQEWLCATHASPGAPTIESDARIIEAAAIMAKDGVDHLVVVKPGTMEALGTLSSLDLALCTFANTPFLRSLPVWTGPTVGELVGQQWHLTAVCNKGTTLKEAADLLLTSGRTSTALALSDDHAPLRLLTDTDLMKAYLYGWEPDKSAENWLLAKLIPRSSHPSHVMVPPALHLTEAASLMISAARPGEEPVHHLVVKGVKGVDGGWLGVFSALDVARGISTISSELELAKSGADKITVAMVMKTLDMVPKVLPGATLQQSFTALVASGQTAAVVFSETGLPSSTLVTPRAALQALSQGLPLETTVASFMVLLHGGFSDIPREVTPDTRLLQAATIMAARCVHHLVVVDPQQGPVGIVSSLDLVRAVAAMRSNCPFTSLGWMRAVRGPGTCRVAGPCRQSGNGSRQ